ncbi:MAG TPA: hypothetical protein VL418_17785 [Devosiaceae bacterium]|nr:hypothetical protein [Devosiaceae bacterium]
MPSIKLRLALLTAFCFTATAADAAGTAAPTAAATVAPVPAATAGTMITMAQADAIIMQSGFTPLGQPKQKGNIIGSLARIGNNAFIVTVDAMTGKFLDAKLTNIPLPPLAANPPPAGGVTAPLAPAANTHMPPPAANNSVSPVKRAADLARSKGFKVLSFRHSSDDTFLVARRGNDLFSLKIDDRGHILAIVPMNQPQRSLGSLTGRDGDRDDHRK